MTSHYIIYGDPSDKKQRRKLERFQTQGEAWEAFRECINPTMARHYNSFTLVYFDHTEQCEKILAYITLEPMESA